MKKFILLAFAMTSAVAVFATQTAFVKLSLKGVDGNLVDELRLTENDVRTPAYESGYDATSMMTQSTSHNVLIYGYVGTQPCSAVATNNLDGLKIGFTTNTHDVNYVLTFSNFSGRELKLYDAVVDSVITINGTTPAYNFTATAGQVAVTDRFSIGEPAPVTPGICHHYGKLQVTGMKGTNVVVKNMDDSATSIGTVAITNKYQEIDLSGLTAGQYKVDYNDGTAHTVIIKVQ